MSDLNYAEIYDKLYKNGYRKSRNVSGAKLFHYMSSIVPRFNTYLDVGCGYGELVQQVSYRGDINAWGIDIAQSAIEDGATQGLNLKQGSVTEIPFDDNSFDFVTCFDCLEHIDPDDTMKAITELVRVTKVCLGLQICTNRTKNQFPEIIPNMHPNVKTKQEWKGLFKLLPVRQLYYGEHKSHVHFLFTKDLLGAKQKK